MMAELEKLIPLGLKSVLLFSVTDMQKVLALLNFDHNIKKKNIGLDACCLTM